MGLLLAVLLAFLAQNLITSWPFDFAAVCSVLAVLGLVLTVRGQATRGLRPPVLAGLVLFMSVAWQLLPTWIAGSLFILLAGFLFMWQTLDSPSNEAAAVPARSAIRRFEIAALAVVIAVSAVLCVYDNAQIPPGLHGDEAESGIEARNINAGKYDTLIGVGWYDQALPSFLVQAIGLRWFGDNAGGLRTTSAIISLVTLPLVYLLVRRLFGVRVGLLATTLMAVSHWFIAYAHIGINYNQTLLLEVLAIWSFWEGWQTRKWGWWLVCALATGAGLYMYFASRLVPILLGVFGLYTWWYTRRQPRGAGAPPRLLLGQLAVWGALSLLIFMPMGAFFLNHAKEFNSRAAFVFLFTDTQFNTKEEKLKLYTGTEDIPTALSVQITRYATLFNVGGDRSGQYGNSVPLIDYYTGAFFLLGLAYVLYRFTEPRYMLLLLWLTLTLFIGGVLTIESPFTPRIIGAMPVPFILGALAIDRLWLKLDAVLGRTDGQQPVQEWQGIAGRLAGRGVRLIERSGRGILTASLLLLLCAAAYFNYWDYFEHYLHSIDGWAQREPATAVAHYAAQMQPDQTLYVLSAPELYVWHGTIRFLAPHLRGYDLLELPGDLPVRDAGTQRASFVMLPNYLQWLDTLRKLYPHGKQLDFRRPSGELWYTIYEVNADEIAAKR